MRSNDLTDLTREELRQRLQNAIQNDDQDAFSEAVEQLLQSVQEEVMEEQAQSMQELREEMDSRTLTARGVRQLTSEERAYYQKLIPAMNSSDPRQAVGSLDVVMPKTVIDSVFEDLRTNHPLLSKINFMATAGVIEMIMNTNGYQEAAWGALTAEVTKELTSGFKKVNASLMKLSAFVPVAKAMLDLGPEWLDRYIREILYEAMANGLEAGIVSGTGKDMPIGMIRQVGDSVTVTGGVYPEKEAITVTDLTPDTIGNLLSLMSTDPNGKVRPVNDLILVVNPADYYLKVMPATTLMAPDGSYRNDVLPYPMSVIQSPAVSRNKAVLGIANRYFAAAGSSRDGKIEYSDEYKFLEDERVYLIKTYANGTPKDNNSFILLDISGLQPAVWKVEQVVTVSPSSDATLSDLKIGGLALTPVFTPTITSYAVSTTNATNTISAFPADAGAEIAITVGETEVSNGTPAAWGDGENTVSVTVTAADGTTTKTYTVTVTKS